MPKEELKVLRERMEKVIEHLKGEFLAIRTGRAHPGLVATSRWIITELPPPSSRLPLSRSPREDRLPFLPSTGRPSARREGHSGFIPRRDAPERRRNHPGEPA